MAKLEQHRLPPSPPSEPDDPLLALKASVSSFREFAEPFRHEIREFRQEVLSDIRALREDLLGTGQELEHLKRRLKGEIAEFFDGLSRSLEDVRRRIVGLLDLYVASFSLLFFLLLLIFAYILLSV